MIAGVLVATQWALESVFHHRVGVYFGYAELLTAMVVIAFILYESDEICGRGSRNCMDGGEHVGHGFRVGGFVGFDCDAASPFVHAAPVAMVSKSRNVTVP
jgi:hypothetical protein